MKKFYIFLDIDGVMNDFTYWNECKEKNKNSKYMNMQDYPFNPKSLNNLMLLQHYLLKKQIIMRIVLSSTWRLNNISKAIVNSRLAEYGMTIFDKTPQLDRLPLNKLNSHRSYEIQEWLNKNKKPKKFLILDDDSDILNNFEDKYCIHTDEKYGFTDKKLQESIKKVEEQYGIKEPN